MGNYYSFDVNRMLEIEILGKEIDGHYGKYVTDKMRVIKELSKEDIYNYFVKNCTSLSKDPDWLVRLTLASQGFCLEKLSQDRCKKVQDEAKRKLKLL